MTTVRKGQAPAKLNRDEFHLVFSRDFYDPAYQAVAKELAAVEEVAWKAYVDSHKAPITVKAGPGFADPAYDLSVEWKEAHDRLLAAEARQKDPATPHRILLINGAARNDGSCPSEISKTWRLTQMESELLRYLVRNAGQVIARRTILEKVWGLHEDTDTRAIDNFIVRLRRYIEDRPASPKFLLTVRGIGYQFDPEGRDRDGE